MRKSFNQKFFLSFFITLGTLQAFGFSEYKKYADQLWEFELNSSLYQTQNNYSRSGNTFDSLANGGSYSLTNVDLGGRWSFTKSWALYTEARMGAAESKLSGVTRSTSQFNQVTLGTDFILSDGNFRLTPDLQVVMPLARVDSSSNNVQTAEGAVEASAKMIARFDWSSFLNQTFLGMTYRDEGRSTLLTYGAGTEIPVGFGSLGAEVRGFSSVINDQYTSNPSTRETTALRVNGGSTKFNSINPSLLESNFWYRWDNKKWGLQVGAGTSITGASISAGSQFFANFIYRLTAKEIQKSQPAPRTDLDKFKEETNDGVDQVLFQPPPPPKPVPVKSSPAKAAQKKRKKLKDELDQTEMQVELKSIKKTKKDTSSP